MTGFAKATHPLVSVVLYRLLSYILHPDEESAKGSDEQSFILHLDEESAKGSDDAREDENFDSDQEPERLKKN